MSTQLCMARNNLERLTEIRVPPGFSVQTYRPGFEKEWETIIERAFGHFFGFAFLADDPAFDPQRVFFALNPEGIPVATASAFWKEAWGSDAGYLHMVAAHPDYGGMGLGYAVTLAAMHRLAAENRTQAFLQTDDHRLPAIRMYLKLGYEPRLMDWEHIERWRRILPKLGYAGLLEKLLL